MAWIGGSAVIFAALFAVGAPCWTLALGPIVLGVAHLVADLRYLVLRPGLHRAPALVIVTLAGLGLSLLDWGVRGALVAAIAAAALTRGEPLRRAAVVFGAAAAFAFAWAAGPVSDIAFAHVHNLVALVLWWTWRARRPLAHLAPVALSAAVVVAVASGALDGLLAAAFAAGPRGTGLDLAALSREVAWEVTPRVARRAVALFAFGQSLHYAVWLRLIPDEARPGGGTRAWRTSWRALRRDVPGWLLGGAFAAGVGIVAMAVVDLADARRRYLQLAFFHGYVELVALARRAAGEAPA